MGPGYDGRHAEGSYHAMSARGSILELWRVDVQAFSSHVGLLVWFRLTLPRGEEVALAVMEGDGRRGIRYTP